jgi:hypothetical protein
MQGASPYEWRLQATQKKTMSTPNILQNDTHQNDTHQNDTHQNDTHQNDTHQNDTHQNDTWQKGAQQNDFNLDSHWKSWHTDLSFILHIFIMPRDRVLSVDQRVVVLLSAFLLNVVALYTGIAFTFYTLL